MMKSFPYIGCCGIGCGLCPRFYTEGTSRCPGCGGEGFESKHPSCSHKSCCADKYGLEICSQCAEFPCSRYENKEKIERDSFVTHKRIFQNHEMVRTVGFDEFIKTQENRVLLLQEMLNNYDDGRSKGFFCLAAALLSEINIRAAINEMVNCDGDAKSKTSTLKSILNKYAEIEGVDLKLIK